MESITCCLSTWVTVAALLKISLSLVLWQVFWVCGKQISEQLSYIALKTFGPGQRPKILFQAPGQLAGS